MQNFNSDALPLDVSGETIQYDVAFLLVEFIHMKYGATQLTVLLNALPQHEGWETLAPTLFNLSADEFEQAWHEYLAAQYRS